MKVVLFCGGLGTRIREYSESVPKPMIPLGHQPILHHVMEYYSDYGHNDFVLCLGYKANVVKDFSLTYGRKHLRIVWFPMVGVMFACSKRSIATGA